MAESLVSTIIEQLVKVLTEIATQELKLVTGAEKEVEKLRSNFEAIQCVLEDAEQRQFGEKRVGHWLARLKEVAYDMDDVLDEWRSAILKLEIDGVESVYVRKKVCSFLSCFASCRQVARRRDIATKIKEINEEVDVIAKEKDMYHFATSETKPPRRLETKSFVDVSRLHGRDEVRNEIVSTLLGGNDIQTISILGIGGLGKTALAHLIFNDHQVRAHFKNVIWVCVSDSFDQNKIARAILGGLYRDSISNLQNPIPLEIVLTKICEKIETTKFLLVLDDVRTDRDEDWESLKAAFQQGMSGSRILVTTRKESVATGMGSSQSQVFRLKELSDEVCWLILSQVAFVGRDNDLYENLEDIGREIAKKCRGVPLAAKSLGSLLREKKTRNEWQNILYSEIWKLDFAKEYIFTPLLLSYYDLPLQIRPCLLYCAIFPKDFEFCPGRLIRHWVALGYLDSYENSGNEEEKGEEYLNYLASRSFFQDFEKDEDGKIVRCKMHDMVHDFVQYLSNEEMVTVDVGSSENLRLNLSSKKARHLGIINTNNNKFPASIDGIEKLRSFVNFIGLECEANDEALQALFKGAKCLRLFEYGPDRFQLSELVVIEYPISVTIPKEIGKLIHLRYLELSNFKLHLNELPEELCNLVNLRYLNLSGTTVEKLPEGIGKLINLKYLLISSYGSSEYFPKGIRRLTSLRELHTIIARVDGNDVKEFSFGDLENLDNLRGNIVIHLAGNEVDVEEAKRAKLHKKINLRSLCIYHRNCASEDFDRFIQALNPPPGLRIIRRRATFDFDLS